MAHFKKHSQSINALVDVTEAMLNKMEEYNIKSVLFPSYQYFNQSVSFSLLNELRKRVVSGENILLCFTNKKLDVPYYK